MRVFVSKRQRKKRAQRRLTLGLIAVLLVAAIGGWLYGFIAYVKAMPQPDHRQQGVTSGAAVVLTGGPLRVTSGLALLTSGQIEQLLISGVHADFSTRSLTAIARGAKLDTKLDRLISCCITLGYAAHDTVGNAKETALWAALYEVTSVRVVTAQYHMARALLEFDAAMPHVAIIADPVFPPDVKQDTWYRWPGTLFLFTQEYSKLQLARLRVRLQQLLPNLRP
jgi:uncharacterized SAM-binding protein YcdF (DUF218 family)